MPRSSRIESAVGVGLSLRLLQGQTTVIRPRSGGERIRLAQADAQPLGNAPQQQIAGLVAQGVVDHLEPVDVDEQKADGQLIATRAGNGLL